MARAAVCGELRPTTVAATRRARERHPGRSRRVLGPGGSWRLCGTPGYPNRGDAGAHPTVTSPPHLAGDRHAGAPAAHRAEHDRCRTADPDESELTGSTSLCLDVSSDHRWVCVRGPDQVLGRWGRVQRKEAAMMPITERAEAIGAPSGRSMRGGRCCSPTSRPTTSWPLARGTPCEFCAARFSHVRADLAGPREGQRELRASRRCRRRDR